MSRTIFASALIFSLVLLAPIAAQSLDKAPAPKQTALKQLDEQTALVGELSQKIWEYAETAFQEFQSSKLLADTLEQHGFRVRREVAGMKTAFVAEYGSGKPVVAILAEYDALPGLAQEATTEQQPRRGLAGHGCGHNLFGAASTGAALAVKTAILQHKLTGTVRLYGCPAEEGGSGKVYLARAGEFKDVDAALHWHPGTRNTAAMRTSLAVIRFRVRFHGKAAHAAGSPQAGRSALDGVELMNVGTNYLREHIIDAARVHYVITRGGGRPNIVPETAEVWYYIRAPKMAQAQEIYERVKKIAQGAALMSETRQEIVMVTGSYEILENEPLGRLMDANLRLVGAPKFTADEEKFATALRKTLSLNDARDGEGPLDTSIGKFGYESGFGSTDVGDVSWLVPTAGLGIATGARGIPGHSWSTVACSGTTLGKRGAVVAAKVLAATAVDMLLDPAQLAAAKQDFDVRTSGTKYQAILDPGPPPERLDDFGQ